MVKEVSWVTIPKYPNYEMSLDLQVRHGKLQKIKKFYTDENGYFRTNLQFDGKRVKPGQHQLVALTFIPNPENKPEVNHIDGNKKNNAISNLEWATQLENKKHAAENELVAHKINKEGVSFIRENFFKLGTKGLAEKFKVSTLTISSIASGRSRKNVATPPVEIPSFKRIVDINTGAIYESVHELAKITGISFVKLRRMVSGERYNDTSFRYLGQEDKVKERPHVVKTPIAVFDKTGNEIQRFASIEECAKHIGSQPHQIKEFLNGKVSQVKRVRFKVIKDGIFIEPTPFLSKRPIKKPPKIRGPITPRKAVSRYSLAGELLETYPSLGAAARSMDSDIDNFRKGIK